MPPDVLLFSGLNDVITGGSKQSFTLSWRCTAVILAEVVLVKRPAMQREQLFAFDDEENLPLLHIEHTLSLVVVGCVVTYSPEIQIVLATQ